MNTPEVPEPDPLAELLTTPTRSMGDGRFRSALFARTTGVMRRRRMVRRTASVATLAGCYLAGVATTGLLSRSENAERLSVVTKSSNVSEAVQETNEQTLSSEQKPSRQSAQQLAESDPPPQSRFEFFRAAGDHQLLTRGDMTAAVRLYARALEVATPVELAISTESDNWLLMSLKQSRLQEVRNALNEG